MRQKHQLLNKNNMKKIVSILILCFLIVCNGFAQKGKTVTTKTKDKIKTTSTFTTLSKGVSYKIVSTKLNNEKIKPGDLLSVNLFGIGKTTKGKDTVMFNTYGNGKPFYIPVTEPTFNEVFLKLNKNDSALLHINVDSLFTNSFGKPSPDFLAKNSIIKFNLKVEDVFDEKEVEELRETERAKIVAKDSVELNAYLRKLTNVKTTSSGLKYIVAKSTTGVIPNKGDQVQMLYSGFLLDGTKFDENLNTENPFAFTLGVGQVIAGWDEGVLMMHEGEEYKFIIPSYLGYGEQGTGPIPPNATLVFDVKLLKVKPANK
jgi:FKBP-type peptidyl-prolyl cis-trans isomerase